MCITDKICSEVCKQILKFSVDENNKCKLPENEVCEESNDKCSELCIHKGYLSDEKTN